MKFDQSLAVKLLKTIDNFPIDALLRPEVTDFTMSQLEAMISHQLDEMPSGTLLWHLYILSTSGLIYPSMPLKYIQSLATKYKSIGSTPPQGKPGYHFLTNALPGIVAEHALTIQGYEYLKNHDQ